MNKMYDVNVHVEYCGPCGYQKQFLEMTEPILHNIPHAQISAVEGRQDSFEIKINDKLVHSKLQTLAFPDFDEVYNIVKEVAGGLPTRTARKHQPIDCIIS